MTQYTDLQLDALRELANIGSGTASTALSSMLGRSVDITVPNAFVLPMADAVGAIGDPEAEVTGVVLGVMGDMARVRAAALHAQRRQADVRACWASRRAPRSASRR